MEINEKELRRALKMATSTTWEDGFPKVRAQLRLAVNSLKSQSRGELPTSWKAMNALIKRSSNRGIRQILRKEEITTEAFAFAIRDSLS